MLYELRRYRMTPSGAAAFEAGFRDELLPLLFEHGFDLCGAWTVAIEEGSELQWLLRWSDLAARQAAYDAVRADPRNDRFRDRHLQHMVSTSSEILTPTSFSPLN
jgi:hypothetical protein